MRNATGVTGAADLERLHGGRHRRSTLRRARIAPDDDAAWAFVPPTWRGVAPAFAHSCAARPRASGSSRAWLAPITRWADPTPTPTSMRSSRAEVEQNDNAGVRWRASASTARGMDDPGRTDGACRAAGLRRAGAAWRATSFTLADLEPPTTAAEAAPLLAGAFDLSLRPSAHARCQRPAVYAFTGRAVEEQRRLPGPARDRLLVLGAMRRG